MAFAQQTVRVRDGKTGAFARDGLFHCAADQTIAERDDQSQHQDTDNAPRAAFPQQQHAGNGQHRIKNGITAEKGHYLVENGIAQTEIDESEQAEVHGLEPMHSQDNLIRLGRLKNEIKRAIMGL